LDHVTSTNKASQARAVRALARKQRDCIATMLRSGGGVLARALRQSGASERLPQVLPGAAAAAQSIHSGAGEAAAEGAAGNRNWLRWAAAGGVATALGAGTHVALAIDEAEFGLHPPQYPWPHNGLFSSYDHASIRRGYQVYQQVCAACHSVQQLHFRNLVDVAYTEDEGKAMAADIEVEDGPDDEGEMFERPGRLADPLPRPYANENAARAANGGAYPPDLSLITKARHDGQNYVFSLLTGYREPPAGVSVREGLHYNPYFPGGAIAMPKMLNDEGVEYDDGTPATESQQAKDVTTFLAWAAEPEHDERKLMGTKFIFVMSMVLITAVYYKRWKWAPIKSRRVILDVLN